MKNLTLPTKNTWCPGCGNFALFESIKKALSALEKKGRKKEDFVMVAGIGCHGKIADYISINTFYGLHGRAIPVASGIKTGNPRLNVLCCSGDGDSYNEGISHLIHAAKRNSNITVVVHDNHNFALTVKQATSTSPKGFKGSTTPEGSVETPFNPMELMLASGATFIARSYAINMDHLAQMIERGMEHNGFSFIEVLQPCVTWFNTLEKYNKRVYKLTEEKDVSKKKAFSAIREWDYNDGGKIPIGVFYKEEKPSFEDQILAGIEKKRKADPVKLIKKHA